MLYYIYVYLLFRGHLFSPSHRRMICGCRVLARLRPTEHSLEFLIEIVIYSESSSRSSKPLRSAEASMPRDTAYSINAKWQNTYWSGICIEYARWDRIFSTVPRMSAVPTSSKRDMQMSNVMKVPAKGGWAIGVNRMSEWIVQLLAGCTYQSFQCQHCNGQPMGVRADGRPMYRPNLWPFSPVARGIFAGNSAWPLPMLAPHNLAS